MWGLRPNFGIAIACLMVVPEISGELDLESVGPIMAKGLTR